MITCLQRKVWIVIRRYSVLQVWKTLSFSLPLATGLHWDSGGSFLCSLEPCCFRVPVNADMWVYVVNTARRLLLRVRWQWKWLKLFREQATLVFASDVVQQVLSWVVKELALLLELLAIDHLLQTLDLLCLSTLWRLREHWNDVGVNGLLNDWFVSVVDFCPRTTKRYLVVFALNAISRNNLG